jgi:hypothetical protein
MAKATQRRRRRRRTTIKKKKFKGGMDPQPPSKKLKFSPQAAGGGGASYFKSLSLEDLEEYSPTPFPTDNMFQFLGETYDGMTSQPIGELEVDINKINIGTKHYGIHYSGVIPSSIGKFKKLQLFSTVGHVARTIRIVGELPQEMCQLQHLSHFICDMDIQPEGKFLYPNFSNLKQVSLTLQPVEGAKSVTPLLNDLATPDRQSRLDFLSLNGGTDPLTTRVFDAGTIPDTIATLSSLKRLILMNLNLRGQIPMQLDGLQHLRELILMDNHLTGELPASIGALTSLTTLNISNNELSGELPLTISNLTGLVCLDVTNNNFEGILPDLSGLTNLQALRLSQNSFTELKAAADTIFRRNPPFMLEIRQRENPQLWFDGFLCFFKDGCARTSEEVRLLQRTHLDIIETDIGQLYHYLAICREANGFYPPHEPGEELVLHHLLSVLMPLGWDGYDEYNNAFYYPDKKELLLQMYEFISHNYYDLK